ncbi:MAG: ATP-binding protein [Candidatus Omnitrophica bacterium]|nr:ATP-binding protein [Candidatus Omnitrophota bacterium]
MTYVPRQIEPLLKRLVGQFPSVAVTGPRQCGKSTLLRELFGSTHRYLSFDDPLLREQATADPKLFLENAGERVILDEIQYVPQLLSYVKILIDQERRKTGRFIVTGSQQFSMIKDLGDSLAGRIALLDLLPFHTEEQALIPALSRKLASLREAFLHACLNSAFPELNLNPEMDHRAWYGSYLQTYLERDIRTLYNIGDLREFQRFMQLLAARTAQILNLTAFSRDLGVSVNTVKKWLSLLEASRMVYLLSPYYQHFGKRVTKSPKAYFLDCGLACYLTGVETEAHVLNGPMAGALFETYCLQETLKTLLFQGKRPRLYYLRIQNGLEIDLLIEGRNLELFPCEIKLTKTPKLDMAHAIERFKSLFLKLKVGQGRILCLAEEDYTLTKNVKVQALPQYWAWLRTIA